jgi:hypothetical protein
MQHERRDLSHGSDAALLDLEGVPGLEGDGLIRSASHSPWSIGHIDRSRSVRAVMDEPEPT